MARSDRKRSRAPGRPAPRGLVLEVHAPAGAALQGWSGRGAWVVIALAALALLWIAFRRHAIGDYTTESDFYGGYIDGARLFQQGRPDPSRYPVAGPGYDAALALVGFVVRDLFTAAKLLSIASALGVLVLWRSLLVRRVSADLALWTVAFLATNAVFMRYGYSATTDMFAIFLQAAALHALIGAEDRFAPWRGGVFAALAALTRYNAIYLLPFGIAYVLWLAPAAGRARGRTALAFLGGFLLVAAPWVGFSLASGAVPGSALFGNLTNFYMVGDKSRNAQDLFPATVDSLEAARSFERVAAHDPLAFVAKILRNVPDHLWRDGIDLLGRPVALTALVGLAFALAGGLARPLLPVWLAGALCFGTLVPVFSSDRYSLAIAPAYMTMAAAVAAARGFALRFRGRGLPLKWLVLLVPLALSLRANVALQKDIALKLPLEVLEAAPVLRRESAPGDRVMSRKAHIGYYAGRPTVPFPRVATLAELAAYCRESDVRFIWYSWYEALLRPEFRYLADTTAVVPGLTRLVATRYAAGALFRVGPEFGREPDWFADPHLLALHRSRANVLILPPTGVELPLSHVVIAADDLDEGRYAEALGHLRIALPLRPQDPIAWELAGHALRGLGRFDEAIVAYQKAQAIHPADPRLRLSIAWARQGIRGIGPMDAADTPPPPTR